MSHHSHHYGSHLFKWWSTRSVKTLQEFFTVQRMGLSSFLIVFFFEGTAFRSYYALNRKVGCNTAISPECTTFQYWTYKNDTVCLFSAFFHNSFEQIQGVRLRELNLISVSIPYCICYRLKCK